MSDEWPAWVHDQVGRPPRSARYLRKVSVVRLYVRERRAAGHCVTHDEIRRLLTALGRGYSTSNHELSRTLESSFKSGDVARYPNSRAVWHAGVHHHSIREAAKKAGLAVETVRRKALQEIDGWSFSAPQNEN